MTAFELQYTGDPIDTAILMSGLEFQIHVRNLAPGAIEVRNGHTGKVEHRSEFYDIVCDGCNREIHLTDPLYLLNDWAWCSICWDSHRQYVFEDSVRVVETLAQAKRTRRVP